MLILCRVHPLPRGQIPPSPFFQLLTLGVPVRLGATPGDPKGAAPELGEQTEAILAELLGYSSDDIARLKGAEVV